MALIQSNIASIFFLQCGDERIPGQRTVTVHMGRPVVLGLSGSGQP